MVDLLKLLVILALTIFLLLRRWDLGVVLLLASGLAALLFRYPLLAFVRSVAGGVVARDTLDLALAVFLVLLLAELMRRVQAMETMVSSLSLLVPDSRLALVLLPLMIGLMPMTGGAIFSAPMVNEIGTRLRISPERKTFVNYWFRHAMEYTFPLYSSLLMMAALLETSVYTFVGVSWPLTLVALGAGVLWGVGGVKREREASYAEGPAPPRAAVWRDFLASTWPLWLVVLAVAVFKFNMIVSLLVVNGLLMLVQRIGPRQWRDVLRRSLPVATFSAIFGVMIFKQVLEDAGAVAQVPQALSTLGLPALLVSYVVSVIAGLLTGTAAAALALSVPLVAPLLEAQGFTQLNAGLWLFVAGFSGVLLSPLHLCLALTREYFAAEWVPLYRRIVPAVLLVVLAGLALVLWRK